ncbi:PREDICTED: peptidyl-alpha-hydroxyglycine alpha-amidating lyase 2 [Vollenhovia emeryi]|uniref:peptidyl-alpha-hydroxyglycine alpha-amidating lyase 2 n=1 Tax=Vollenhovia emeryi TaxID=411798 RepID=UPI0005F40F59|nr:PREDICTED: peptidyl-alpha-hydroxyglycine alpha-amidating lyase 2 [Vollenhovia emeryi]XP_011869022.1 PREDICTED: peptidyl-alpha-hydroxyglycine alpha-amidating lyase 2 [Vollenhovia emeryi]XP_011869023.1 PREDICTED: peptidyl-alpha-hydroxyglycine alpha-amidating lyase 2 [Vollenhovia emeryi]
MADEGKRFSRVLSVLAIVILKGVIANINDRGFDDGSNFNGFEVPYRHSHDQFYDAPLHPVENRFWRNPENLGEVSGVAVDSTGNLVIFHRGDRSWNYDTFNEDGEYQEKYKGPIRDNTVLTLDSKTGEIIHGWGNQTFYLPHGIHVDPFGNIWLTDIALHQVFKYSASGVLQLVLGQRFEPGSDIGHFCQPTSVAVLPSGEVVVADGYCNNRLLIFDNRGKPLFITDERWISFRIPHALTILPNRQICVADRENWRIVCLTFTGLSENVEPLYSIRHRQFGRIFGIASYHGFIYAVNGMTARNIPIEGFTIDPIKQNVTGFWGPESSYFKTPHAIAVCPYGKALYVSEIGPNKIWKFDLVTKP